VGKEHGFGRGAFFILEGGESFEVVTFAIVPLLIADDHAVEEALVLC
jgi:hypothetical protein